MDLFQLALTIIAVTLVVVPVVGYTICGVVRIHYRYKMRFTINCVLLQKGETLESMDKPVNV